MEDHTSTDEVSIPTENTRNTPRMNAVGTRRKVGTKTFPWAAAAAVDHTPPSPPPNTPRKSVRRKFSDLLTYFNPFRANLTPQAEDIPAAKKPRLETSVSTAADVDVGPGAAAQTTARLTTASLSDIVAVVPKDVVTVSSPLQSTEAPRAPVRKWTAEEDATLTDAVKKHGIDWVAVTALVPGRNKVQCRERWAYVAPFMKGKYARTGAGEGVAAHTTDAVATASPNDIVDVAPAPKDVVPVSAPLQSTEPRVPVRKFRKWIAEEDAKLTVAVKKHGNNWVEVASLVPGRNNKDCRNRWNNSVDPSVDRKMGKWKAKEDAKLNEGARAPPRRGWIPEEDAQLSSAVEKYGNDWIKVAKLVPGRSNRLCRARWSQGMAMEARNARAGRRTPISRAADVGLGAAAHTTDTLATVSPNDLVAVASRDVVTVSPRLQRRKAPRAPRRKSRKWTAEQDAKLTAAVKKHVNSWVTNWVAVAKLVPGRNNKDCRNRWANFADPSVDRTLGKWTAKEDAKLTDAATKYGGKDWVAVAVLVPGRTNERCRERWVNYLDPNTKRTVGRWTADEDATLTDAVAKHGNNWVAVAALVPGRLNEQCRERWMHSEHHRISPTLGYWTAEEDAKLTDAVKKHGKEWVAVAALVPGRNNKKCRQRWTTQLDPNINNRKWTAEEDAKMMDAVTECGNDWVAIAALVPGRTNWQCRERWRVLLSDRQR